MNGQQRYKAPDRRVADPDACSTAVAVADPVPTAGPYRHNWNPEFSSEPPTDTEPAERRIVSVLASSMRMRTTQWLYEGRMPAGAISLLAGREGIGKALGVDTPILTDRGWVTMDEVKVGDSVRHPDGGWTAVVAATPPMADRPCYRVTFDDGSEIVADGSHLWRTETLNAREGRKGEIAAVVTTEQIAATLRARDGHCLNHAIPTCAPLEGPDATLPIDPYVLGAWLGDGHSASARLTCDDVEIVERIRSAGEPCRKTGRMAYLLSDGIRRGSSDTSATLHSRLRVLGVLNAKHIPDAYFAASAAQRLALLQGLMDTDGSIGTQHGRCEFSVCSERLAADVQTLATSLGIKVTCARSPAVLNGRTVGTRWRLSFRTDLPVFHLPRKANRIRPATTRRHRLRYITAVAQIDSVLVRCIQVAAEDGMFLAGANLIPTHNSTIGFDIAAQLTRGELPGRYLGKPQNVGIVASEDDWECVILPRLVAARADLTRVHRVEVQVDNKLDTISAPNDLQMLRDWCAEHEIRLLIIDPIMSVIQGSLDTHKDREVRQALDPLSRFAAQTRVGILGLIHVNKSSTTDPLNSVMASRAFTAVARSVLYCVLDPEAEGEDRYLFGHPKCNVGPKQPTISYTIMQVTLEIDPALVEDGDDAEVVTSRVKWGEQDDRSIRDALEGPPKERAKGEVNTSILTWITDQDRVVARAEIGAAFPDIKIPTVDQNLSRMVKGGQLVRPFAGHYQAVMTTKARAA